MTETALNGHGALHADASTLESQPSEPPPGAVVLPAPTAPYDVAAELYGRLRDGNGIRTLLAYRGGWMEWRITHWYETDAAKVRAGVYHMLQGSFYKEYQTVPPPKPKKGPKRGSAPNSAQGAQDAQDSPQTDTGGKTAGQTASAQDAPDAQDPIVALTRAVLIPWEPNRRKVADVLEAMEAIGHLSSEVDPPAWIPQLEKQLGEKPVHLVQQHETAGHSIRGAAQDPVHLVQPTDGDTIAASDAQHVISCTNGLLDVRTRTQLRHTPKLFNLIAVPLDYNAVAPPPAAWLKFLKTIWPDETGDDGKPLLSKDGQPVNKPISLLQEWFGYVLSGRLEKQKMLALIGPIRSGKGTIVWVLTRLLGGNVAKPTIASLSTNFGMAPLIGKPLAVVADARTGAGSADIVERLLNITGEDEVTIDRKFKQHWTGKLPTRLMLLSNEVPKFEDAPGAIPTRFMFLQMTKSFLGQEDEDLKNKLEPELPSILNWALEGLDRLDENGRFTVPEFSDDLVVEMQDMASPMSAFVRERCVCSSGEKVRHHTLYERYREWCEQSGHYPDDKSVFGRDLRSVVPTLKSTQLTDDDGKRRWYYVGITLRKPCPVCGVNELSTPQEIKDGKCAECDKRQKARQSADSMPLFEDTPPNGASLNGEGKRCACGNDLNTSDAINSGMCRPCRNKWFASYDT